METMPNGTVTPRINSNAFQGYCFKPIKSAFLSEKGGWAAAGPPQPLPPPDDEMNDFHILDDDAYVRELMLMLKKAKQSRDPRERALASELLRRAAAELQLPPDQRRLTGREAMAWMRRLGVSSLPGCRFEHPMTRLLA